MCLTGSLLRSNEYSQVHGHTDGPGETQRVTEENKRTRGWERDLQGKGPDMGKWETDSRVKAIRMHYMHV